MSEIDQNPAKIRTCSKGDLILIQILLLSVARDWYDLATKKELMNKYWIPANTFSKDLEYHQFLVYNHYDNAQVVMVKWQALMADKVG